ncbi:MAG TPA: 3-deoxy-D-manno-octulosonic acid transferase [Syntrophobacter fumaroxidans]|nr:3-deoxy-D-manno-octulosonic acid transferase [Syntrophobacter fumaroxidans]
MKPAAVAAPLAGMFYNASLTLSWPLFLLYYLVRSKTDGKYRSNLRERMGVSLPPRSSRTSRRIWIHALSVGETVSVTPLVKELKIRCPELEVVVSSATESGRRIAEEQLAPFAALFFTLPHDFPWAMKKVVERIRPDLFVLVETDIWPNLLASLRRSRIPALLLNGRISPGSFRKLVPWKACIGGLYRAFDLIFAQSAEDRERYLALGALPEKVVAAGNLKFDASGSLPTAEESAALRESAGIDPDRPVWIAGSTHEGEEDLLLRVHRSLLLEHPRLLLILAPRQPTRRSEVLALCESHDLSAVARSSGRTAHDGSVYLLDTMGELGRFYAFADVAYIGGSMVPFGGHNPLEAIRHGKPALWGPHLFNFREIEKDLLEAGCACCVPHAAQLENAMRSCLADSARRERMRRAAIEFMASHPGPGPKVARLILERMTRCGRPPGRGGVPEPRNTGE